MHGFNAAEFDLTGKLLEPWWLQLLLRLHSENSDSAATEGFARADPQPSQILTHEESAVISYSVLEEEDIVHNVCT